MTQMNGKNMKAHQTLAAISILALLLAVVAIGCSGRSKADKLHSEGVILAKNHQYFKAIDKFEQVLKLQPDRTDTLVQCAEVYLNTEKYDLAASYAEKAIAKAPGETNAYLIVGQAHLSKSQTPTTEAEGGAPKIDKAEIGKAVDVVAQLRRVKPDALEGILLQARIDKVNGNLDSAERLFRAALNRDGKNITAMLGMAEVLMSKRQFGKAEEIARQAVRSEKEPSSMALDDLAVSLAMQDKFEEAYATLAPYVKQTNKMPEIAHFLIAGRILLTQIDRIDNPNATTATIASPLPAPVSGTPSEGKKLATQRLADLGRAMKGFFPALPESYFFRAVSYQLQNDSPNAIRSLEEACTKAPRERRFRMALALAHMQDKNYTAARQELRTLLRDHPGDDDGQLRLAQCMALEGSYNDAIDMLRNLVIEQPGNKQFKESLGKVLVLTSEPAKVQEGMELLSKTAGADTTLPGNRELIMAEAAISEGEKQARAGSFKEADSRLGEAERLLNEAARMQPKNYLPELKLSELAVRRGDLFSGLQHVRAAAKIDPQFVPLEARFYAQLGQYDSARERYAQLVKSNPGALGFQLALADLEVQMGRVDDATKSYNGLIAKFRTDPRPYLHRALLIGRNEDVDIAVKFLKDNLKDYNDSFTIRIGLAQLMMKLARTEEAIALQNDTIGRLTSKITILKSQPEMKAALSEATSLLASINIKMALNQILAGKAAEAAKTAERARALDPGQAMQAQLTKAVACLTQQQTAPAQSALAELNIKPEGVPAAWTLARTLAQVGNPKQAEAVLSEPNNVAAGTLELFQRMIAKTPASKLEGAAAKLTLLVTLTQYPEFGTSSLSVADELLTALPGEPFVLSIKGDILDATGKSAEAMAAYDAIRKSAPEFAGVLLAQSDLHMKAASRAMAQGRAEEKASENKAAADACRTYLTMKPKDAVALEKLGTILQLAGQAEEATANYRKAIEIDPSRWTAYNNLAWNLAEAKKLEEAAQMGQKALAAAAADGGVQDTVGWIELLRGNTDRAIDLLTQASLHLPNNPDVRFHLAQAHQQKGDRARALAELEVIALATPQYPRINEVRDVIRQLNPQSETLNHSEGGSLPKP